MSKNKRMIYLWEDNIDFYDKLSADKKASNFINEALKTARLGGVEDLKTVEVAEEETSSTPRTEGIISDVERMRQRDAARLAEYRKKQGLYDPTKS